MTDWISAHLHFDRDLYGTIGDSIICETVADIVRELEDVGRIRLWFFIRYNDTGPHIRLRLLPGREGEQTLIRSVISSAWGLRSKATRDVQWVPYSPEYDRYGGAELMPSTEALFSASSRFAISELRDGIGGNHSVRLGRGLLAMLVAMREFAGDSANVCEFARSYGAGYLRLRAPTEATLSALLSAFEQARSAQGDRLHPLVRQAWQQILDDEGLSDAFDEYARRIRAYLIDAQHLWHDGRLRFFEQHSRAWEQASLQLGSSHIHMTSNRLGISIPEEAYLAHVLSDALEQSDVS